MKRSRYCSLLLVFSLLPLSGITVQEFSEQLFEHNLDLKALEQSVLQRSYEVELAEAERYPSIESQLSGTYIGNPAAPVYLYPEDVSSLIQWPEGISPSSGGTPVRIYKGQERSYYRYELTLRQPVFTWGKLDDQVALREGFLEIEQLRYEATREQLSYQLWLLFDSCYYLSKISALLEQQQRLYDELLGIMQEYLENGLVLQEEYEARALEALRIETAHSGIEAQIARVGVQLRQLSGDDSFEVGQLEHEVDFQSILQIDTDVLDQREQEVVDPHRPVIKTLITSIETSEYARSLAENSIYWKPDLALAISLGYEGPRLPLLETDWYRQDTWSMNVSLICKANLFDGGKALTEIRMRESLSQSALLELERTKAELLGTYRQAVSELAYHQRMALYHDALLKNDERSLSLSERQYEAGLIDRSELLSVRIAQLGNRIDALQNRLETVREYRLILYLSS